MFIFIMYGCQYLEKSKVENLFTPDVVNMYVKALPNFPPSVRVIFLEQKRKI